MRAPCCAASVDLVPVIEAGRLNYWLDSFYWFGLQGGSGLYRRFSCFAFFPFKKQLVLSLVSNVNKKKNRAIIRRQEFVHGSFAKHLMSIPATLPRRAAQVSTSREVEELLEG